MKLHVTQKVRAKAKIIDMGRLDSSQSLFLESWYVNLFKTGRKEWFIFTEVKTLYSVVLPAKGINSPKSLAELATDVVFGLFRHHREIDQALFEKMADRIEVLKTDNRRILGSQNDLIHMAESVVLYHGDENFSRINESPMSYMGMDSPDRAFARELGLQQTSESQG